MDVPVRGRPVMKIGAATASRAISGWRFRQSVSWRRFSSQFTRSLRTIRRPRVWSCASASSARTNRR